MEKKPTAAAKKPRKPAKAKQGSKSKPKAKTKSRSKAKAKAKARAKSDTKQRRGQRRSYALITNKKGKVLLVRNRRGRWTLPGGRARRGERLRDAVTREVREETGLRVSTRKRVSGEHVRKHRRPCARCVVFRATVDKGKPKPKREIVELAWVNPQKVPKRLRAFRSKEIEQLLARKA